MSRKYERTTLRAHWSAEDMEEAMRSVSSKEMGVNEASRTFGIPYRTLRRHLITGKSKGSLGRRPVFTEEYEKKLVNHIKKLEKVGFAPEKKDVKEMAFQLAKKFNIDNPFSKKSELAGNVWFTGFMARNSELSKRKSEGLSLSRAYGVNRKDVKDFFDLLAKVYNENDFANHPEDIYNMDESGIQVNNKPGKVIATKGAKDVYTLTSSEKGENVTVIACCNAVGNFIPPVLIYKGTYSKPQFSEGLPPGSQVFMNKKSSYINSDLFMKWFEDVFLRYKSPRKTLLILDGHSSHSNNIRLLDLAKENDVILLCLPSHTTHALQPLDRAFFRPLKVYFAQEAKSWMVTNKDKKLTRYDVSKLIGKAWCKAATLSNGISALKSCGIYPFDPSAIPDHYFSLSDSLHEQNLVDADDQTSRESLSLLEDHGDTAPRTQERNPSSSDAENILVTTAVIHSSPHSVAATKSRSSFERYNEEMLVTTRNEVSPSHIVAESEPRTPEQSPTIEVISVTVHSPPRQRLLEPRPSRFNQTKSLTANTLATTTTEDLDIITELEPSYEIGTFSRIPQNEEISVTTRNKESPPHIVAESEPRTPKHSPTIEIISVAGHSPPRQRLLEPRPSIFNQTKSLTAKTLATQDLDKITELEPFYEIATLSRTPQKVSVQRSSSESSGLFTANLDRSTPPKETPTKALCTIYPVPKLPVVISKRKQTAIILTSPENIEKRRLIANKKTLKQQNDQLKKTKISKKEKTGDMKKKLNKGPKKKVLDSSSSESNNNDINDGSGSDDEISKKGIHKTKTKARTEKRKLSKNEKKRKPDETNIKKTKQTSRNNKKKDSSHTLSSLLSMSSESDTEHENKTDISENESKSENLNRKKQKYQHEKPEKSKIAQKRKSSEMKIKRSRTNRKNIKKKKICDPSSSESNDDYENKTDISEEEFSEGDVNKCVECTEDYYETKSNEDWIQCFSCKAWLHEFCTMYSPMCNNCGRKAKRDAITKLKL